MKTSRKLTLGIATMLAGIILGTNVNAMDIYQRTLTNKELLLGAPVDSSITTGNSTTTEKTFNKDEWWDTWKSGGTVKISMNTLKETPELLCVESEAGLPTSMEIDYKKVVDPVKYGEGTSSYATDYGKKEDYKIAYILSEQIRENQTGELYTQDIQGALWRTRYNFDYTDLDTTNLAGEALYNEATVYAEYKDAYKDPEAVNAGEVKTTNQNGTKIVGPFKITYTMKNSNSTAFGEIKEAILQDNNNIQYTHGTDWWFVDANGNEISNTVGEVEYQFPTSGQTFYIKIRSGLNIVKANLSFKFNKMDATAEAMTLRGSYDYPAGEAGKLHLCPSCQKIFDEAFAELKCGDSYSGKQYEGYKIVQGNSGRIACGKTYKKLLGDLPESLANSTWTTARCPDLISVPKYIYTDGSKPNVNQNVKCGNTYEFWIYGGGNGSVELQHVTGQKASCGGKSVGKWTYTFSQCTKDGLEGSCTAHQEAYNNFKPCGKVISKSTKIGKDGKVVIGQTVCGISKGYPEGTAYTQRLTLAQGKRVETPLNFTISFNVASIDISLRKFITKVNNVAVSPSREPQVDVSPLKNGQTTANYNHTKETVNVAVGDLVTYTIRVYNEGVVDGYAREIKDYLPSNLEFASGIVDGVNYNWQVTNEKGREVIKTAFLANTKLEKFSDGTNYNNSLAYADVKVTCKVKSTAQLNEVLLNIAEVSKYAYDENGTIKEISQDVDSSKNNINLPSESNWPYYAGNGTSGSYVKGQEDDDDFERVIVKITDIGGTVWIDGAEGKQEERDGILTNKDKRFQGIRVMLYKRNENGDFVEDEETTTDTNGKYSFNRKSVDNEYIIRFEYAGQQYIPVTVTRLDSDDYTAEKSAAEETVAGRYKLNEKFYEIVKGTARNRSGQNTVALSYTKDENKHTSSIIRNDVFNNGSKIKANTVSFSGTESYVKFINLGLIERAQANLGLMMDVAKVDLSINGQTATYDYNGRDEGTAINLEAKAADINRVYNQAIYKSDYSYRITDYNATGVPVRADQANELQVYITYKIKVKNYSSKDASVSELSAYVAPEYNIVESWYEKGSGKETVTWVSAGETNGYKTIKTNSVKAVNIGANEDLYVYVKVQVAKDASGGIMLGEKYIIAEITGYTTNDGLIDINSEPGNIDISNWDSYVKTYEDDTDRAPGLNLYISETPRTMTGFVWEDSASTQDSDGVNIGDGIKNGNEQNKNGITVQLIEKVTIDGQVYEYIWQETQTGSNKVSYMDREGKLHEHSKEVAVGTGEYKFTDYVPGTYIIRFKYGDTEASIDLNGQDYKSTTYKGFGENTSSAKDNKDRRLAVMNYSIEQTNAKGEVLSGKDSSKHQELINNTWMYADTVEAITIGINDENPGHKVNFGLLKRPISKLVAIKEVNGIKISNKGIIYVDTANGINTGLREAYGSYYIELDDELINGAHLEIGYKIRIENQGEKDTLYNYFEGEAKYGSNQHELIKTQALLVYDYPEKLGYDEDRTINPSWTKEGVDVRILSGEVQSKISGGALVVKATEKLDKALKPGESTDTIYMTLSKIMAAGGNDDLSYSNKVEIVSRLNEVGRRDEESIPGNYVPLSKVTEPDTGIADVTITDPTGETRIYYGLGIGAGILLIVGIVLIKRFALSKKK